MSKGICPNYNVWGFHIKSFGGSGMPVEQGHCTHYYNQCNKWSDSDKTPCCVCGKKEPTDWAYKFFGVLVVFSLAGAFIALACLQNMK